MEKAFNAIYMFEDFHADGDDESPCEFISEGSFGQVYCGIAKDGKKVAIKQLTHFLSDNFDLDLLRAKQRLFMREIYTQCMVDHPCVVPFYGYGLPSLFANEEEGHVTNPPLIITEFMPNGTLDDILYDSPDFWTDTCRYKCLYGIAAGMACCHSHNIIHRDLKPENVFFDENYEARIADFGYAKIQSESTQQNSQQAGSPLLMAPEVIQGDDYDTKCDVYSFAMIAWECLTNEPPFEAENITQIDQLFRAVLSGKRPLFNSAIPHCWQKLIDKNWDNNPRERMSFNEICRELEKPEYFIGISNLDELTNYFAKCRPK